MNLCYKQPKRGALSVFFSLVSDISRMFPFIANAEEKDSGAICNSWLFHKKQKHLN